MNLKKDLTSGKLVFGQREVLRKVKTGKLSTVYVASNTPQKNVIKHTCEVFNVNCVEVPENNKELAVLCKKTFAISVVGVE